VSRVCTTTRVVLGGQLFSGPVISSSRPIEGTIFWTTSPERNLSFKPLSEATHPSPFACAHASQRCERQLQLTCHKSFLLYFSEAVTVAAAAVVRCRFTQLLVVALGSCPRGINREEGQRDDYPSGIQIFTEQGLIRSRKRKDRARDLSWCGCCFVGFINVVPRGGLQQHLALFLLASPAAAASRQ
jgi:hypothetical protein